ncbi:two-component regulator propeller domain-containing protein [Sediminibacterium sp. KACHI17]
MLFYKRILNLGSFIQVFILVAFLCMCGCNEPTQNTMNTEALNLTIKKSSSQNEVGYKAPQQYFLANLPTPKKTKITGVQTSIGNQESSANHFFIDKNTNLPIPEEAQGKALFTTYTSDDGLALDQVHSSYKDRNGHLWFGTNGGGVSRFDGKKFTNYTNLHGLASNIVWSILEDRNGNIWFGTDGNGVSKYDGKVFTNYSTKEGLSGDVVFSIKEDRKGMLWFGTSGGITKYDGKRFSKYTVTEGLYNNTIKDILEDRKGDLWFATLGGGVSRYNGSSFTTYRLGNGLTSDTIRSIYEDVKGNIWFGTNSAGLCKYDGVRFVSYTIKDGLAGNKIMTVRGDSKGNIWIGTNGGGVSKFDGKKFINYTSRNGLESSRVPCITEDDRGNLWFGTFGGGVSKFGGNGFSNYTVKQGLPNNIIYGITEDRSGNLWLGSFGGGICKYDLKSFTGYSLAQGLSNYNIYCAAKDSKGNLWFGTFEGGVIQFDGQYFTQYTTANGLAGDIVFCIKEDSKGNLWFGTSTGGVSKFDGKSFVNYTQEQGLPVNGVFCITEDSSGDLWFGTYGGGISKFDGKSFINFNTQQGLADNTVWTITEDNKKNLWFGTQQGLNMMTKEMVNTFHFLSSKDTVLTKPIFQTYTIRNGLPDNFVTQIVEGNDHILYVGTNLGMFELIADSSADQTQPSWHVGKVFNTITGYPIKDVNAGQGAMYLDSKGIIWIATGSEKTGLVRFDPTAIRNTSSKPPVLVIQKLKINNENPIWNDLDSLGVDHDKAVVIEEMNAFGRQLNDDERVQQKNKFKKIKFSGINSWYPIPQDLVLPYERNSIGFEFNAIETDKNYLVKYQYKLEGYDKDWSPWTNTTTASFGNIDEGSYTFMLKAQNDQGLVSEPLMYTFKVLPPWWRTWWMYVFYVVAVFAGITFVFRWNTRRILQQKKTLEQKVVLATQQIRQEKENVEIQKQIAEDTLKQLKDTQTQLIQSEKMASLGELTAGIAHEIQNPLNFVNNFSEVSAELLEEMKQEIDKGNLDDVKDIAGDIQQNLQKIHYHGKRAGDIVKGMLQHSRSSSGQKEPIAINNLCDEYCRLAYHGLKAKDKTFNAGFETKFDESIGVIQVMPQEIGRVILNLINNALYAVNERKRSGEKDYEPMVFIETKKHENEISITVADNGMGVPEHIKSKIFQPFFTTKPTGEGTGLGLSLSYDIITKGHGGRLTLESESGKGTKFIIHLPV